MAEESSNPPADQDPVTVPQPSAAEKGTEDLLLNVEEHHSPVAMGEKSEEEPLPKESKSLAAIMEKEESLSPPTAALDETAKEKGKSLDTKEEVVAEESGQEKNQIEGKMKIPQTLESSKEESNKVADLSDSDRKALEELKQLVQDALNTRQLGSPPAPPPPSTKGEEKLISAEEGRKSKIEEYPEKGSQEEATKEEPKVASLPDQVSIWGIPLLKDDRSDVILLKFLRARDFKVKDAFTMLKNTIQWRKDFGIDELVNEDLGDDLEKVVFMHGHDKEGHPVCYNVYGEFQNKKLYDNTFSGEEKRMKFLRWRIQFLERSIRMLDFSPGGISTIFQVNDLKNSPGPGKRELRLATRQGLQLLQDNYPEFVAKQVFINVPWWYLAFYTMINPFLTQRTKSKFVFSGPSKYAETLFKYISPEQVPIQYGGLSVDYCECNPEFVVADPATELTVKPATKQTVQIIIYEKCVIVWEIRVVGWEVSYGAEFVPDAKDAYTVIIQKATKMAPTDEPVVSNSFRVGELGKLLLTINNPTSKKKKLLYRFKVKPLSD